MSEEFDSGLEELIRAFDTGLIEPIKPLIIEYRLYYDSYGSIIQVSDSNWNHPDSGDYVVVDDAVFKNWMQYRIRDGAAELKPVNPTTETPLKKSNSGYRVVENNPALLLEEGEVAEKIEYYDHRSS